MIRLLYRLLGLIVTARNLASGKPRRIAGHNARRYVFRHVGRWLR
jgi:hypothetical protein